MSFMKSQGLKQKKQKKTGPYSVLFWEFCTQQDLPYRGLYSSLNTDHTTRLEWYILVRSSPTALSVKSTQFII